MSLLKKIFNFLKNKNKDYDQKIDLPILIMRNGERVTELKLDHKRHGFSNESINTEKRINNMIDANILLMFTYNNYILMFEPDQTKNIYITLSSQTEPFQYVIDYRNPIFYRLIDELVYKMIRKEDNHIAKWINKYIPNVLRNT